jgi:NADH-quinone oxidoreductase subunit A
VLITPPPSIVTFLVLTVVVVGVLVLLIGVFSPHKPNEVKSKPYESGVSEPISTQTRWPVRFALVGMLFLIFDVEALFFFPWAVIIRELGWNGILYVTSFFVVLGVGYIYARVRGALEWR